MAPLGPHETPRDLLVRGFALILEALDGYQAALQPKADLEEIMTGAQAAEEAGVTAGAVSNWCKRGFIKGASQRRGRGHWRFARSAWNDFRADHRIRTRRRLVGVAA